jgi:hypothetical protein
LDPKKSRNMVTRHTIVGTLRFNFKLKGSIGVARSEHLMTAVRTVLGYVPVKSGFKSPEWVHAV